MILRAALIALVLSPAAYADVRQAGPAAGTLEFSGVQAGAKFTGTFNNFHVKLDFDPAKPQTGSLDVIVETSSVNTQDGARPGPEEPGFLLGGEAPAGDLPRDTI